MNDTTVDPDMEVLNEKGRRWRDARCRYLEAHPGRQAEIDQRYWKAHPGRAAENTRRWREQNREAEKVSQQRYREENRTKVRAASHRWRENNKEYAAETDRIRNQNNRESRAAYSRRWRLDNPGRAAEITLHWRREHPEESANMRRRRRARESQAIGTHTAADIRLIHKNQKGRCWWCGKKLKGKQYHIDHRVPLALGGSDSPENLVVSCPQCNMRKRIKLPEEFVLRLF